MLQHATFSQPTYSLPKFRHVPLGVGGWPLGCEERKSRVGLIVCAVSFQDFRGYVVLIHQRHRQTDGQTDGMQSQYRALHQSASRSNEDKIITLFRVWGARARSAPYGSTTALLYLSLIHI